MPIPLIVELPDHLPVLSPAAARTLLTIIKQHIERAGAAEQACASAETTTGATENELPGDGSAFE